MVLARAALALKSGLEEARPACLAISAFSAAVIHVPWQPAQLLVKVARPLRAEGMPRG